MTKQELMKIRKFGELFKILEKLNYRECSKHGGSHRIFKAANKPTLSIPCHNSNHSQIAPGTLRNIVKLILSE